MSNELKAIDNSMVSVVNRHDLGEIIRPMIREIHLFDTYIAGTTHLKDDSVLDTIQAGDELILQREDNPFDRKAILVLNGDRQKLGYIPERDNVVFSRLMDAGKKLKAKVAGISKEEWFTKVSIGIYLVDL